MTGSRRDSEGREPRTGATSPYVRAIFALSQGGGTGLEALLLEWRALGAFVGESLGQ